MAVEGFQVGWGLKYNGVEINVTKTNNIHSTVISSEDGVDYLYTKHVIDIDGIINPQATSFIGSANFPGQLPGDTFREIHRFLLEKRKELIWSPGGTEIAFFRDELITDVNNGPNPLSLTITRATGNKTWYIHYVIEVYTSMCNREYSSALISNRFGQIHTIDREFYTIIKTSGVAYFRTDILVNTGTVADAFRDQLLPPIPPGFQRQEVNFRVSTRGNMIEYDCTEREKPYDLGNTGANGSGTFITHADGFYNISTIPGKSEDGTALPSGQCMATMNVKLWGSKRASNWTLTQIAFMIMGSSNKMQISQRGIALVHQFSITQSITDRHVDVTLSMRLTSDKNSEFGTIRTSGLKIDKVFPDFNGINPQPPLADGAKGDANLTLLSSALREACIQPTGILNGSGSGAVTMSYQGPPPVVSVQPTQYIPPSENKYTQQSTQFMYTQSTIDSYYMTKNGVYQAPISGSIQSSSSGGGTSESLAEGKSCSIVNLHVPMTRRVVEWTAERIMVPPELPSPNSKNQNQVLLETTINMAELGVTPDGTTPTFKVTGRYVYAMKKSIVDVPQIAFDVPQYIDYPYGTAYLQLPPKDQNDGGNFRNGIINP